MKNKVREMIINIIQENAVAVKELASRELFNKVGNSLSQKYVEMSQQIFTEENEGTAPPRPLPYAQQMTPSPNPTSQYAPGSEPPVYDPRNKFWDTNNGRQFMVGWNYLIANARDPRAWNQPGAYDYMASPEAFEAWLRARAAKFGIAPPPLPI
jgi:hypothetical protein